RAPGFRSRETRGGEDRIARSGPGEILLGAAGRDSRRTRGRGTGGSKDMSLQTEEVAITGESAARDEAAPLRILMTADPELPVPPKLYGGIERIIDSLVRGLEARGHEVALVSHPESECPASRKFA